MQARRDATHASAVEEADAAISAWAARECSRISRQKLTEEEEKLRGGLANAAKERKPAAWVTYKVFQPVGESAPPKSFIGTRSARSGKMVDGEQDVERRVLRKALRTWRMVWLRPLGASVLDRLALRPFSWEI